MTLPKNHIDLDTLTKARSKLGTVKRKVKTVFSKREAIAELEGEIREAMTLDHTLIDVAKMLKEIGLDIKPEALGKLLRALDTKTGVRKRRTKSKVVTPVSDEAVEPSQPDAAVQESDAQPAAEAPQTDDLDEAAFDKLLDDLDNSTSG